MNFKYTAKNLKKLEQILEEAGYIVRYEKGHFNSGYCLLENKKVLVIKRFLDTESKINVILELMPELSIDQDEISPELLPILNMAIAKTII